MSQGVGVAGLYVRDQDEALEFYVGKLGFKVHTDARNGDYRWLTVQHPEQPSFQLGLFKPQPPTVDDRTAGAIEEIVAKGAMPPLVFIVDDCRATYEQLRRAGSSSRRSRWSATAALTPASVIRPETGGK